MLTPGECAALSSKVRAADGRVARVDDITGLSSFRLDSPRPYGPEYERLYDPAESHHLP